MTQLIASLLITVAGFMNPAVPAQANPFPFTGFAAPSSTNPIVLPARVVSFSGSVNNKKVVLKWVVSENETAEQFEVEKSSDGINFRTVALVFGTDKPSVDNYQFYEKAGNHRASYRIKLVNKNKETLYSDVIQVKPGA